MADKHKHHFGIRDNHSRGKVAELVKLAMASR